MVPSHLVLGVVATWCFVWAAAPGAHGVPTSAGNAIQTEDDLVNSIHADCLRKDSVSCLKYQIYSLVDRTLGRQGDIALTEGVTIVKTGDGETEGAPRALNTGDGLESVILSRLQRFLESHTVKVDLKGGDIVAAVSSAARSLGDLVETVSEDGDEDEDESNGLSEESRGRKKKGKKKNMGPIMGLIGLKLALLGKLAITAIGFIAIKALLIGKLALVLAALNAFKKLFSGGGGGGGKHTTYEVVAEPHHDHHGSGSASGGYSYGSSGHGGGGGWGRSAEEQQLAYRGHTQASLQQ